MGSEYIRQAMNNIKTFIADDTAATTSEYAVLLALITVSIVTALNTFGEKFTHVISSSTSVLPQ